MKFYLMFLLSILSFVSVAELLEIKDEQLSQYRGQAVANLNEDVPVNAPLLDFQRDSLDINASSIPSLPSAGITLDINLQLHIEEISWVDSDGVGPTGQQGAITLKGFSAGHIESGVLSPASIRGVTIDVGG